MFVSVPSSCLSNARCPGKEHNDMAIDAVRTMRACCQTTVTVNGIPKCHRVSHQPMTKWLKGQHTLSWCWLLLFFKRAWSLGTVQCAEPRRMACSIHNRWIDRSCTDDRKTIFHRYRRARTGKIRRRHMTLSASVGKIVMAYDYCLL